MLLVRFVVLDPRFRNVIPSEARLELLFSGVRFGEDPGWFGGGRYLLWSDIPNDGLLRWDETSGTVSTFRQPSHHANCNTLDGEGRLITAQHSGRCVTRTEHDGAITFLSTSIDGKPFNSPCDVVVKSDGSIWFTDADYGIRSDWEDEMAGSENGSYDVYRIDGATGALMPVADDLEQPNGMGFSPDESVLYVAASGITDRPDGARHICAYPVIGGVTLGSPSVVATCDAGFYDGFCIDVIGNIWESPDDGVHCIASDGTVIGKILVPGGTANLTFEERRCSRLFLCGPEHLWSLFVNARSTRYASIAHD